MFWHLNLPNIPEKKPYRLNFNQLPPNHNPLILSDYEDTFDNIHASLCMLKRLVLDCEHMELRYSERETRGVLCMLECMEHAMRFELYHRDEQKNKDE